MGTYTNDMLFVQAMDSYPYEIEQCVEKLQYILGGNDHAGAYYLMGRIYDEQLHDYKKAKEYYHQALCIDHEYVETYYYYILLLVTLGEYTEAEKVIDIGMSLVQSDKARLQFAKSIMLEKQQKLAKAKKSLKISKDLALNNEFRYFIDEQLRRVEEKLKSKKKKRTKKQNKKTEQTVSEFNSLLDW